VLFDWVLGALVPVGLGLTALAGDDAIAPNARSALAWTALGLYSATRAGVLVIGNLSEYNLRVTLRLGAATAGGRLEPALSLNATW